MNFDTPLRFEPLFMERVWGGRELERFGRKLPAGKALIGESWELVDRPEAQSVVSGGDFAGLTLHELWMKWREPIFGFSKSSVERFPLLIKLLDARERLSLQVHPPASVAASLGGEPKTECWYILDAEPGAEIYAGLRRGVRREDFENALHSGDVERLAHRFPAREGDAIFIPSGRVHAIGAGTVILETQENSDTTYRVFDWNRLGLDGKPRELHIKESLASINFEDFEPGPVAAREGVLVKNELFCLERLRVGAGEALMPFQRDAGKFVLVFVLSGSAQFGEEHLRRHDLVLLPAAARCDFRAGPQGVDVLRISSGEGPA